MADHLVYYLRGEGSEELRYSLRSVAKNMNVGSLTIVGDTPSWVQDVESLPGNPRNEAYENSFANIIIASKAHRGDFYVFNDDFFVLAPVTDPIPAYWDMPLYSLAGLERDPRSARRRSLTLQTNAYLTAKNVVMPRSFETHTPMPINGEELLRIVAEHWRHFNYAHPPRWRSLYGNLARGVSTSATQRVDVKHHLISDTVRSLDLLSTDERTFKNFRDMLEERFPEKSPWER